MKVLVTGSTGFVGARLVKTLQNTAVSVTAVSRELASTYVSHNRHSIDEIDKFTDWTNVLKEIDVVIHLAAIAHILDKSLTIDYDNVNHLATINLAKQANQLGVKRFVFLSSIGVNGIETVIPFNEAKQPNPTEPYAASKNEAEIALRKLAETTNLEVVIIRPPLVYGKNPKGNFKRLIDLCQSRTPLPFGAINNKRSLIYIENLVDFIILCINHPKAANETFVIADDDDVSTTDLIKAIRLASGNRPLLIPIPHKLLVWVLKLLGKHALATRLCGNLQIDISKAKNLLGWKPPYSFKEGIAKTMQNDS